MTPAIHVAPLQGFTEAPFRHFHAAIYGGATCYYSPFIRLDDGAPRRRDMREITSPLNANHNLIPQIIVRDAAEFSTLLAAVADTGHRCVDINMGCPFPPQVNRGRGAGFLARHREMNDIAAIMSEHPEITFSVKMRLGVKSPDEWRGAIDIINLMPLSHLTVHPRTAVQQYGGELHFDSFGQLADMSRHPIVFNGEIRTPDDIDRVIDRVPQIEGIMIGRGMLARPSLINEWRERQPWDRTKRLEHILKLHSAIFGYYSETLCGETQLLSKLKPFWEYLKEEIGKKPAKLIAKSTRLTSYRSAVASID